MSKCPHCGHDTTGLEARDRPGLTAEDVLIAARKAGIDWWGTEDGGVTFAHPAEKHTTTDADLLATLDAARPSGEDPHGDGRPPLPALTKAHDDGYMAGLIRGREIERVAARPSGEVDVLTAIQHLKMRYEPGSTSPAYENGWYDGRGAAAQVVRDAARPSGEVDAIMAIIEDAFAAEQATRQGNGWSDVHGRGFILIRVRAALDGRREEG